MASFDATAAPNSDTMDDGLYDKRQSVLRRLKISVFVLLVISLAWIAVGAVTISKARPDNHIPYAIGGGCIGGGMSIFYVLIVLGMVKAGRSTPKGKNTTSDGFKCLTRCHFVMAAFLWMALLVGFGIAGIWGFIECATRTQKDDTADFSLNFCEPDKDTLYLLSIGSLILGAVSMLILTLTHCFFCCNFKAFGMRHYQGYRGAYIDYNAGEERPPITLHDVPASQPLYIRTEHGFQEVQPSKPTAPSAPPFSQIDIHRDRDYGRRPNQPSPRDRRDDDRYRDRRDDDRGPRGRGHRGRGHRGRGRGRGPRDRSPERDRDGRHDDRRSRGRGRRRDDRSPHDRRHEDGRSHDRDNTSTSERDGDGNTNQKEEPPPSYTEVMDKGNSDLKIDVV